MRPVSRREAKLSFGEGATTAREQARWAGKTDRKKTNKKNNHKPAQKWTTSGAEETIECECRRDQGLGSRAGAEGIRGKP